METFNPFSLKGKSILVTGASSGIGRETAIICSKMGAQILVTGRNEERLRLTLNKLEGDGHMSLSVDLDETDQVNNLVKQCSLLDGIVHCAGIGDRTLLRNVQEKDIERVMNTNFNGPVLLQRMLLKAKKVKAKASIVFIASRAPFAPTIGNGLYSASKGALIAYSKVLGLELASKLIRVNCICPAMVWTELIERDASLLGIDYHEEEKTYPLKRYGKSEDIANLVVYLLSDASSWMTGSCIDITGGANSL
ncbi:MAG: SDR family oxidoreductase [Muribaculaceae bacterium]|nr:SDR family oxidoreductase [Muribaculaceae bacterium]